MGLAKEGDVLMRNFDPSEGSYERQYHLSDFNLPVSQVSKTAYGSNLKYHTSKNNKEFVCLYHPKLTPTVLSKTYL